MPPSPGDLVLLFYVGIREEWRPFESRLNRDSPDQTTFPGYSSRGDTAKYNPAFQERQMRPDAA